MNSFFTFAAVLIQVKPILFFFPRSQDVLEGKLQIMLLTALCFLTDTIQQAAKLAEAIPLKQRSEEGSHAGSLVHAGLHPDPDRLPGRGRASGS